MPAEPLPHGQTADVVITSRELIHALKVARAEFDAQYKTAKINRGRRAEHLESISTLHMELTELLSDTNIDSKEASDRLCIQINQRLRRVINRHANQNLTHCINGAKDKGALALQSHIDALPSLESRASAAENRTPIHAALPVMRNSIQTEGLSTASLDTHRTEVVSSTLKEVTNTTPIKEQTSDELLKELELAAQPIQDGQKYSELAYELYDRMLWSVLHSHRNLLQCGKLGDHELIDVRRIVKNIMDRLALVGNAIATGKLVVDKKNLLREIKDNVESITAGLSSSNSEQGKSRAVADHRDRILLELWEATKEAVEDIIEDGTLLAENSPAGARKSIDEFSPEHQVIIREELGATLEQRKWPTERQIHRTIHRCLGGRTGVRARVWGDLRASLLELFHQVRYVPGFAERNLILLKNRVPAELSLGLQEKLAKEHEIIEAQFSRILKAKNRLHIEDVAVIAEIIGREVYDGNRIWKSKGTSSDFRESIYRQWRKFAVKNGLHRHERADDRMIHTDDPQVHRIIDEELMPLIEASQWPTEREIQFTIMRIERECLEGCFVGNFPGIRSYLIDLFRKSGIRERLYLASRDPHSEPFYIGKYKGPAELSRALYTSLQKEHGEVRLFLGNLVPTQSALTQDDMELLRHTVWIHVYEKKAIWKSGTGRPDIVKQDNDFDVFVQRLWDRLKKDHETYVAERRERMKSEAEVLASRQTRTAPAPPSRLIDTEQPMELSLAEKAPRTQEQLRGNPVQALSYLCALHIAEILLRSFAVSLMKKRTIHVRLPDGMTMPLRNSIEFDTHLLYHLEGVIKTYIEQQMLAKATDNGTPAEKLRAYSAQHPEAAIELTQAVISSCQSYPCCQGCPEVLDALLTDVPHMDALLDKVPECDWNLPGTLRSKAYASILTGRDPMMPFLSEEREIVDTFLRAKGMAARIQRGESPELLMNELDAQGAFKEIANMINAEYHANDDFRSSRMVQEVAQTLFDTYGVPTRPDASDVMYVIHEESLPPETIEAMEETIRWVKDIPMPGASGHMSMWAMIKAHADVLEKFLDSGGRFITRDRALNSLAMVNAWREKLIDVRSYKGGQRLRLRQGTDPEDLVRSIVSGMINGPNVKFGPDIDEDPFYFALQNYKGIKGGIKTIRSAIEGICLAERELSNIEIEIGEISSQISALQNSIAEISEQDRNDLPRVTNEELQTNLVDFLSRHTALYLHAKVALEQQSALIKAKEAVSASKNEFDSKVAGISTNQTKPEDLPEVAARMQSDLRVLQELEKRLSTEGCVSMQYSDYETIMRVYQSVRSAGEDISNHAFENITSPMQGETVDIAKLETEGTLLVERCRIQKMRNEMDMLQKNVAILTAQKQSIEEGSFPALRGEVARRASLEEQLHAAEERLREILDHMNVPPLLRNSHD